MSSNWYGLTADETIDRLQTSLGGLNASEVQTRRQQFGPNEIAFVKTPAWIRFLRQFNDPMVIILLITAGITGALSLVAIELDKFVRRSKGQYGVPWSSTRGCCLHFSQSNRIHATRVIEIAASSSEHV